MNGALSRAAHFMARYRLNDRRMAARRAETRAWPMAYRMALLYLMVPVAIWLLGWFKWWIGWPAAGLLAWTLREPLRGPWRVAPRPATWGLLLLALGWVMTTAAGGAFDRGNYDWIDHRALLLDLGRYPWPSFLPDALWAYLPMSDAAPSAPLLRYYLGWYMTPGLAARLGGLGALQWAVPLWTWMGVALLLRLATQGCRGWRVWLAAAVLMFFSGMDVLRAALLEKRPCLDMRLERAGLPEFVFGCFPFEWWSHIELQYMSPMAALRWVPQHFIPAGLGILLLWRLRRNPRFLAVSGVWLAAIAFWSPFVAVGLLPFLALSLRANGLRPFLRWPNLCLAGPLAGLIAVYLTAGALEFPRGWLWMRYAWPQLARTLPLFYLTEFLAVALLLALARPTVRREAFFLTSLAVLLLLPWYYYHYSFALRVSLPALLVLGCHCAHTVAGQGRAFRFAGENRSRRWALGGLVCALGLGALTGVVELTRALRDYRPFLYAPATLTNLELPAYVQRENLAFDLPPWLARWLRKPIPLAPEGKLIARAAFDVYWDAGQLLYVQDPCVWDSDRDQLFLQARPAAHAVFPETFSARQDLTGQVRRLGEACGLIWRRPPWAIAALRIGQQGRVNWVADIVLDATGGIVCTDYRDEQALSVGYQALSACPRALGRQGGGWETISHPLAARRAYRSAAAMATTRAPRARGRFHAYLRGRALTLYKRPCRPMDTEARFFVHAFPAAGDSLPDARRAVGFANLDFAFAERGARFDATCVAVVRLPGYALSRLRIGQFLPTGPLWTSEIQLVDPAAAAAQALRMAYQALAGTPPALQDVFDVYLTDERAIAFVKDACRPADTAAKFILHVFPERRWVLPWPRWRYGFANLGFAFERYGAHFDGRCMARVALPRYAIRSLRVGQFDSRAQRDLWKAAMPMAPAPGRARSE